MIIGMMLSASFLRAQRHGWGEDDDGSFGNIDG